MRCARPLGVLAAVLLVAACAGASAGPAKEADLPTLGPSTVAYDGDVGDPFVLRVDQPGGSRYIVYGTGDRPARVPTATSNDLVHWQRGPDALPVLPGWAAPDPRNSETWAPAVVHVGDRYLLYVTVPERASGRQCIAVAAADDPLGPYADALGRPLVCQAALGGSIDPSVTSDGKGGFVLVWKSDGNCCGLPARLWEQDLAGDGLTSSGPEHLLLTAGASWQAGVVENPAVLAATGGGWWLFYSGNRFDEVGYATGLAWCPTLRGPCRETADRPFLAGTATQYAPGGLDFFRDAGGRLLAAFATWSRPPRDGRFRCCRPLDIAPVTRW
jgi:hypothetical protein